MDKYYLAYEDRYRKVSEAGISWWGHSPNNKALSETLRKWVKENSLTGGKVIEFACGEGAGGVILSKLGCLYHGIDVSPLAVEKTRESLKPYPCADAEVLDMVTQNAGGPYRAALDVMGLHMLVTDADRARYLKHAFDSLEKGAPMLFFRESYQQDAYEGAVSSFEEWKKITGTDYETPEKRFTKDGRTSVEIPRIPARAKNKNGYIQEMEEAGFLVDRFIESDQNFQCPSSACLFVHKP